MLKMKNVVSEVMDCVQLDQSPAHHSEWLLT